MFFSKEETTKLTAILLNQVEGLQWYYFDALLQQDVILDHCHRFTCLHDFDIHVFLSQIKAVSDVHFEYEGDELPPDVLLNLVLHAVCEHPFLVKEMMRRIFDSNAFPNSSESKKGLLGRLNKKNQRRRERIFWKKIHEGHRSGISDKKVILAEGDSWFEFPPFGPIDFVSDILDHLVTDREYAVLSMAEAGDWLSNMVYTGEYIEELPRIMPDIFLLSGGGNDLVGSRLGQMVRHVGLEDAIDGTFIDNLISRRNGHPHPTYDKEKFSRGCELLTREFFDFINALFIQYFILFFNVKIRTSRFSKVLMVTHGYDYAIPRKRIVYLPLFSGGIRQWVAGRFTGTMTWLHQPLSVKGIIEPQDQRSVIYTMLYEFNEMLLLFHHWDQLENTIHVDLRGIAQENEWFDEIHLTGECFSKVSRAFKDAFQKM
jgi:hypothetical protein